MGHLVSRRNASEGPRCIGALDGASPDPGGERFKVLDYKKGEQARDWYARRGLAPGSIDPEIVPYYLLLIGPPDQIPFEFQYLLGVDYAVGRLSFDAPEDYERYARSTAAYESARSVPNGKEVAYWGTRHLGDPATELSASMLVDPLANGIAGAAGALKQAINEPGRLRSQAEAWRRRDKGKPARDAARSQATGDAVYRVARHGAAFRPGRPGQRPGRAVMPGLAGLRQCAAGAFPCRHRHRRRCQCQWGRRIAVRLLWRRHARRQISS